MQIERVRLSDPAAQLLVTGLTEEYEARYGPNGEMSRAPHAEFDPPSGLFVVLVDGDVTLAGGGFRRYDDTTCEVKRMWTHPDHRRRGLATVVLTALEDGAAEAGYSKLVLETGPRQPEAEAMYKARGYSRIDFYGPYSEALAFSFDLTRR